MGKHVEIAHLIIIIRSLCTEPSRDHEESRTINQTQAVELSEVKVETKQRDLPTDHSKLLDNDNTKNSAIVNNAKSSPLVLKEKENVQRYIYPFAMLERLITLLKTFFTFITNLYIFLQKRPVARVNKFSAGRI